MILVQSACLSSFMTPMATPAVPMCMSMGGYDVKSLIKQSLLRRPSSVSYPSYDEFLCRFSKTADGTLYYMGEKV